MLSNTPGYRARFVSLRCSSKEKEARRVQFQVGVCVSKVLDEVSREEAARRAMVVDSEPSLLVYPFGTYVGYF